MSGKIKLILFALTTLITVFILSFVLPNPIVNIYHQQEEALAQTAENTFNTYENPTYGINVQYPSNWRVDEGDVYSDDYVIDIVSFLAPITSYSEAYSPYVSLSMDTPHPI